MPNCVQMPGICHTIDNLLHDVDRKLESWEWFYDRLKNCNAILGRDQAKRRLVHTCVDHRAPPHHESLWQKTLPNLYEPRWGQVISFLRLALPMLEILRGCWDKALYEGGGSGKGQDASAGVIFDAELLSETLSSNKFFLYCHMVLNLHQLLSELGGFVETCPCHSPMLQGKSASSGLSVTNATLSRFIVFLLGVAHHLPSEARLLSNIP